MLNSVLISTLKSFTTKEMREFGELVRSPYFNKNQSAIKLFEYLKKCYPEFDAKKLEKETIYKTLFGKAEYSEGFMKTITHILTNLSEKFLFQINLNRKPALEKLMISEEMNKRKLEKQFSRSLKETEKEIEKINGINEGKYYYYSYVYNSLRLEYLTWTKFKNKHLRDFEPEFLQGLTVSLSFYYIEQLLSAYRSVTTWRQLFPVKFDDRLADNIISFLLENDNEFIKNINLRIHLYEVLLIKDGKEEYFHKLKEILFSETDNISKNDRYSLMTVLQEYCTKRGSYGVRGFLEERFRMYKLSLEKNFYKLDTELYINPLLFGSIAQTAIALNELDWAEKFISKYKNELPSENDDIILNYITARLLFAKEEFSGALEALNSISSIVHIPYKIVIRNLMLMIYYELSYFEQGEYLLESSIKFLVTNKEHFSEDRMKRQQNFHKYYSRLIDYNFRNRKTDIDDMVDQLQSNIILIERRWLLSKAIDLGKK